MAEEGVGSQLDSPKTMGRFKLGSGIQAPRLISKVQEQLPGCTRVMRPYTHDVLFVHN